MAKKINKKRAKKDNLVIPKKAMLGIAPAIAIIVILLARNKAPEALLFSIGIITRQIVPIQILVSLQELLEVVV